MNNTHSIPFTSQHNNPLLEQDLTITHIHQEPYSFVKKVLQNSDIPKNLTFVPPTAEQANEEALYYFIIAAVIIIIVVFSFCKNSDKAKNQSYSSLAGRATFNQILHLEEEPDLSLE